MVKLLNSTNLKTVFKFNLLLFFLVLIPTSLTINLYSSNDGSTDIIEWIAPEPDNIYYIEDLNIDILKDGSISKTWSIIDHGLNNISFPIELPTPVNSSSQVLQDLRVRLAVVQHEEFSDSWGPITFQDRSYEFIYDDEIESILSHLFLEFYTLVEDSDNQTLIDPIISELISRMEELWEGVTFFKFNQVITGPNGRRQRQIWRAFPSKTNIQSVIEYLLDNCLPIGIGLLKIDKSAFLKTSHVSIHMVANWDGSEEFGSDSYDQEPYFSDDTEDFDERWEFIAGINEYEKEAINIKQDSINTIYFNRIIPFTGSLGSHPLANYSEFRLNLYHGSQIVNAKPNFIDSPRYRGIYTLNMLDDSGEGKSYELPDFANLNFTDGSNNVPVLIVDVKTNQNIVDYGENVTLTYNVTNIGQKTAYSVELEDDVSFILRFGDFSIVQGDTDSDGSVDAEWDKIEPSTYEIYQAIINCNESGGYFITDPVLEYHSSIYADISEWERNPHDYGGGYQIDGQEIMVLCNHSTGILNIDVKSFETSISVGDRITIFMEIKNTGNENLTNVFWQSPILGINTTPAAGLIENIDPDQTIMLNTSFIIDFPLRYMGGFIEPRFYGSYSEGFVEFLFEETYLISIDAKEIPLNIFPKTNAEYGPLIELLRKQVEIEGIGENDYYQVTIYVKNSGDTPAYNAWISDNYPLENFTIISGSPSVSWDYIPVDFEFSFSYIVEYPFDLSSDTQVSYLTAIFDLGYQWLSGYGTENTYKISQPSDLGPLFTFILILGLIGSVGVAVFLGVLLIRERGVI